MAELQKITVNLQCSLPLKSNAELISALQIFFAQQQVKDYSIQLSGEKQT